VESEASKKEEEEDTISSSAGTDSGGIYVDMIRPFFRDFDLSACSLLAYQLSSDTSNDLTNIVNFPVTILL
jgi:hypothetical protein